MNRFQDFLSSNLLVLDGGMGSLLQDSGLPAGTSPEKWNLSHPDVVSGIHKAYFDAGCNLVNTNTFGANLLHFSEDELRVLIPAAVRNAKRAALESTSDREKFVSLDIGPLGRLLKPFGDLDFEEAVRIFALTVRIGAEAGVDAVTVETMTDTYETKAAVLAVKENCDLPLLVTNAFGSDQKLLTGASPEAVVALLEGLGADAIGVNCSQGPDALLPVVREYLKYSSLPVLFKPNAGLPREENGKTVYDLTPETFAEKVASAVDEGVRGVGGCCGTTPAHLASLVSAIAGKKPKPIEPKRFTTVSSYSAAVSFGQNPVIIGERINPTGKKRFQEALRAHDLDYVLSEGLAEEKAGAQILDVNVGLPGIDETALLCEAVTNLQAVIPLPLQIDSASPAAMERALRLYNGKPLVNSVNGKAESMSAVFPLMKKYGGVAVALTLDENGIPATAEGRAEIAGRIIENAQKYGIDPKNLIFDPLTMAVSADPSAAKVTLDALALIRSRFGALTMLGVSNVSFGLPARGILNAAFLTMAMTRGLSAAILNPFSAEMIGAVKSFRVLSGLDGHCAEYLEYAGTLPAGQGNPQSSPVNTRRDEASLSSAIVAGRKESAQKRCAELCKTLDGLTVINDEIIPALNEVGKAYEEKRIFLPQLLMSAEAAGAAFSEIRANTPAQKEQVKKGTVILATVKGDIHDIGKNIVRLLLESYGFEVLDLGKDVSPAAILEETLAKGIRLVGLSALMTTTVPAMKETIGLLREQAPGTRIVVGGAVLTASYAAAIGADRYAADAMETVRYANEIFGV